MKLTIGFEAETQHLSLVKINTTSKHIQYHPEFWTYPLNNHVSIYPDALSDTYYIAMEKIKPFINAINAQEFEELQINQYKLKKENINEPFFDAEFIVTYDVLQEVDNNRLFQFILHNLKRAIDDITIVIDKFNHVEEIKISKGQRGLLNRRIKFPYKYLATSEEFPDLLLFYEDKPNEIMQKRFVFQCTLGIPIIESINIMNDLIRIAKHYKVIQKSYDILENTMRIVNSILQNGQFSVDRLPFITNYLFLFIYSYLTKQDRKKNAAFIIRHSFGWSLQKFLSPEEKMIIGSWILNLYNSIYPYYYSTHLNPHQDTEEYCKNIQFISDVSCPVEFNGDIILIEFRLLNAILCKLLKTDNLSLHLLKKYKILSFI